MNFLKDTKSFIKILLFSLFDNKSNWDFVKTEYSTSDKIAKEFFENSKHSRFDSIESFQCKPNNDFKWVGGVRYENSIYCIANSATQIMNINTDTNNVEYFGELESGRFKWTGGCVYNNMIYGFPRTSNDLLVINPKSNMVSVKQLKLNYKREHHYCGVLTEKGVVYQAPRNSNHILAIDLNDFSTHEIYLCPKKFKIKFRYCGGVSHPNGLIYFFPEKDEKVLVFNPVDETYAFIGKRLNCMVFDCAIAEDGNLYGFSGYANGLLKIDTKKNSADMICESIGVPGCYGTKLGVDGNLYGIPGNTDCIWQFDVKTQTAKVINHIDDSSPTKCAGAVVTRKGDIYCVPAYGNNIYILKFINACGEIPNDMLDTVYFTDTY